MDFIEAAVRKGMTEVQMARFALFCAQKCTPIAAEDPVWGFYFLRCTSSVSAFLVEVERLQPTDLHSDDAPASIRRASNLAGGAAHAANVMIDVCMRPGPVRCALAAAAIVARIVENIRWGGHVSWFWMRDAFHLALAALPPAEHASFEDLARAQLEALRQSLRDATR